MKVYGDKQIWLYLGSQQLYGQEVLGRVSDNGKAVGEFLHSRQDLPAAIVFKGVGTTAAGIYRFCLEANGDANCAGVIVWMHTFSPSKMWLKGLRILHKPLLHLHTQFNARLPWRDIDMDFMNLNQSAHGGREHGFINTAMEKSRKIIVGHWKEKKVLASLNCWIRAAVAHHFMAGAEIGRFGDNMRDVAVTEGNKVTAQMAFGYSVSGYGLEDLKQYTDAVSAADIASLLDEYREQYIWNAPKSATSTFEDAARLELGIQRFLTDHQLCGFTTTFENLYGMAQLPGLACQRLMAKGYGFGAEGDWKMAALVRTMKLMGEGLNGGTSFMEDYTYHFDGADSMIMGAHMLEVCPSIAGKNEIALEVHPLGIGGKADPARLVFQAEPGAALVATVVELKNRYRIIVNPVEVCPPLAKLEKLPVACALWKPEPSLEVSAAAWIMAGGAHHSCFSKAVTTEMLQDYARICEVEILTIDNETTYSSFENSLRWNEFSYAMKK